MQTQQVVAQALGSLSWDLPARVEYAPGAILPFTLGVGNPTTAQRSYGLQAQALVGGEVVWFADLVVDSAQWFPVAGGGSLTIQGQFQADQAGFVLRVVLIDQATNQVVAEVSTELVAPAAAPAPPTPTPTPGMLEQVMPVVGLGLVMGLVAPMMGMFGEEE